MCGIMGFVGKSKDPRRTYELATRLFKETQQRGRDASGFFSVKENGTRAFDKTNVPSSRFVDRRSWKNHCGDSVALIAHTRATTQGPEIHNVNNHPHVTHDANLAIVHNGMISRDYEIIKKENLSTIGQCDSEVILRVIEKYKGYNDTQHGIKKAFDIVCGSGCWSSMACLALSKERGDYKLYAFRNSTNPIFVVDLRNELGQLFFCSTEYIWNNAIRTMSNSIKQAQGLNIKPYHIWSIDINTLNIDVDELEDSKVFNNQYSYGSSNISKDEVFFS